LRGILLNIGGLENVFLKNIFEDKLQWYEGLNNGSKQCGYLEDENSSQKEKEVHRL
jgi:hypothetical protein